MIGVDLLICQKLIVKKRRKKLIMIRMHDAGS